MKKTVALFLSLLLVLCAFVALAEEKTGEYTVFNATGEGITELYLYPAGSDAKGDNLAEGFQKNKQLITYTGDENTVLTLEYTTESGRNAKFETLHIETAPISLLAADAMTGATPISFSKPQGTGEYSIYNQTGENLKELYLYLTGSEEKGTNYAEAFEDGMVLSYTGDTDSVLVLEYTTESDRNGKFETLHIETAPISLLAADAMTGATAISFTKPQATGEYTIYNTTGENLTGLYLYVTGSEDKGVNYAEGFADGQVLSFTGDYDSVLTLEFATEGGQNGAFVSLHVETVPISLLSADAMTGATPISFSAPEGK